MAGDGHGAQGALPPRDPDVGLCAACAHAASQRNARGSVFWRCVGAERDPRLRRYPRLPVSRCHAFERAGS